jgi:hypothetical protein
MPEIVWPPELVEPLTATIAVLLTAVNRMGIGRPG